MKTTQLTAAETEALDVAINKLSGRRHERSYITVKDWENLTPIAEKLHPKLGELFRLLSNPL